MVAFPTNRIDVLTPGAKVTGRNGTARCESIVSLVGPTTVDIWQVNSRRHINNSGIFDIPIESMDEFCMKYLTARGMTISNSGG